MTLIADKRRTVALGLAVLLLAAAVVPLCVMSAEPAMAMPMPMETPAPASSDCDSTEGGSLTTCPHADAEQLPGATARVDGEQVVFLPIALVGDTFLEGFAAAVTPDSREALAPPGHLTPLRL